MHDSKSCEGKLNKYEAYKEANLKSLLKVLGEIEITEKEMHTLKWISGFEIKSIDNICSVIEKVKRRKKIV